MPDSLYRTPEGFFDEHYIYVLSPVGLATASYTPIEQPYYVNAKTPGAQGNAITWEVILSGINTPLSISVSGLAITIRGATNGAGTSTTTGAQLATLVNGNALANLLVVVTPTGGPVLAGTGGAQNLSGGLGTPGQGSSGLFINGTNALNLSIDITPEADFFVLRRVMGLSTVGHQFQLRDYNGRNRFQNPLITPVTNDPSFEWPVCPEIVYPANSQIGFDVYDVLVGQNSGAVIAPYGQVAFQGVRRFNKQKIKAYQTPYRYREMQYIYRQSFDINIPYSDAQGNVSGTFWVNVPITDFDFELYDVTFRTTFDGGVLQNFFAYTLYSPYNRRLSSGPVLETSLNDIVGVPSGELGYNCGAITPPVLYPQNSQIQLEIQSYNPSNVNVLTVEACFIGVNRMPCLHGGYLIP